MMRRVLPALILLAGFAARAAPPEQGLRLPGPGAPPPRQRTVIRAAPRIAVHRVGPGPPRRAPVPRAAIRLPLPPVPPGFHPSLPHPNGPHPNGPHPAGPHPAGPHPAGPAHLAPPGTAKLPVPRFASLRSDEVYLRVGPGFQYPVRWVYRRVGMPVEIERDFGLWRLVVTPDGARGWMHQATLKGRRDGIVTGGRHRLRDGPAPAAAAVAILEPGVILRLLRCDAGAAWCRVDADGHRGWIPRADFWGTFPAEAVRGQ